MRAWKPINKQQLARRQFARKNPAAYIRERLSLIHCDCNHDHELAYKSPAGLDAIIEKALERAFENGVNQSLFDEALWAANIKKMWVGVRNGLPNNWRSEALYKDLADELQDNLYHFAAFKNHQNMTEISQVLIDENGAVRSFQDFKKNAMPIMDQYNKNWLRAEYNQATGSARMASKWKELEARGGKLEYIVVNDDRLRPEHAELAGVVLPVNHPFWDTYYPPNGWNCRCTVKWRTEEAENRFAGQLPKMPAEMQFNPGKMGKVFSPLHPYEQLIAPAAKEEVLDNIRRFRNNVKLAA